MPTGAVTEWKQRKASHAQDPLNAIRGTACPQPDGLVTACVNGVVVASSSRVQWANRRAYFPMEDCAVDHFRSSVKRWR